jgi:murein L,D-transpeptidase YcbB/YkuD
MKWKYLAVTFSVVLLLYACNDQQKKKKKAAVVRDTTITKTTSFNNLFLDSVAIVHFLQNDSEFTKFEQQYIDFYKQRNYEYAWFDTSGLSEQTHNFLNLLNSSINQLQDSSLYSKKLVDVYDELATDSAHHASQQKRLRAELLFTGQFFEYAAKVYSGSDINETDLGWFIPRKKVDMAVLLDSVIHSSSFSADQYVPVNAQYKKMLDYLTKYLEIENKESWDSLPVPETKYKRGDRSETIEQIKHRLFLLGDMEEEDSTLLYDKATVRAVKSLQQRMGLDTDGVIGPKVMAEINYPIKDRISTLYINLERARWMPLQNDSTYILVNIPEYRLHVFDSAEYKFSMNVIVGTAANSTVIFSGKLKYVVFSPYWNVPASIVKKEILPAMQKDANYLARNNMEIYGKSGGLPDIRQKPGANNSLGLVKFLFPNNYNIYLHDTPNHDLFTASNRSFSHGCIRIADPPKMAAFLLRSDTTWTPQKIDSFMHLTKEKWVTINPTVPVYITYFTSWVDRFGKLNFRKDIYGHDAKMADKLFVKK